MHLLLKNFKLLGTAEPQYSEGPRGWQNLFAIPSFFCIEVLFHIFYYYWGKEIVHYTEDFVIWKLIISRLHCMCNNIIRWQMEQL